MNKEKILEEIDRIELVSCDGRGPVGWVYFVVCPDTGRCKIGFTKGKVEKRIASLQTGSASRLSLVAMHPGTPDTERRLHDKFEANRLHGEWFGISDGLRAYLVVTVWAMTEFTLKEGRKLAPWMVSGVESALDSLHTISQELADILEADPK
jgi:hypothetical protein